MSSGPAAIPISGLTLQTRPSVDALIVECRGRLMAEQCEALNAYVRNLLPVARRIILDLKEIARMDSSGLGTVVGLYISAHKSGGELVLINYNKSVKDLLRMTNVLSLFENCARSGARLP
jgi:anti-sigma B factor antagonist